VIRRVCRSASGRNAIYFSLEIRHFRDSQEPLADLHTVFSFLFSFVFSSLCGLTFGRLRCAPVLVKRTVQHRSLWSALRFTRSHEGTKARKERWALLLPSREKNGGAPVLLELSASLLREFNSAIQISFIGGNTISFKRAEIS
jgi:hypothetical protein